jgi:hypothetical protein
MAEQTKLPPAFKELERFVEAWDQPSLTERYAQRLARPMEELSDFHGHMMARGKEIIAYLDAKKFSEYSQEDLRLARLMFALGPVAQAVEVYKTQKVPNTGATSFEFITETELTPGSALLKR